MSALVSVFGESSTGEKNERRQNRPTSHVKPPATRAVHPRACVLFSRDSASESSLTSNHTQRAAEREENNTNETATTAAGRGHTAPPLQISAADSDNHPRFFSLAPVDSQPRTLRHRPPKNKPQTGQKASRQERLGNTKNRTGDLSENTLASSPPKKCQTLGGSWETFSPTSQHLAPCTHLRFGNLGFELLHRVPELVQSLPLGRHLLADARGRVELAKHAHKHTCTHAHTHTRTHAHPRHDELELLTWFFVAICLSAFWAVDAHHASSPVLSFQSPAEKPQKYFRTGVIYRESLAVQPCKRFLCPSSKAPQNCHTAYDIACRLRQRLMESTSAVFYALYCSVILPAAAALQGPPSPGSRPRSGGPAARGRTSSWPGGRPPASAGPFASGSRTPATTTAATTTE